jgi:hypothetical protein
MFFGFCIDANAYPHRLVRWRELFAFSIVILVIIVANIELTPPMHDINFHSLARGSSSINNQNGKSVNPRNPAVNNETKALHLQETLINAEDNTE